MRVVQANAMDLALFQFDYDMSFGTTFLHWDRTVYARYGSRRGNEEMAAADMSMEGLQATMQGVLALHQGYPGNKGRLEGKQPKRPVPYAVPEKHPLLKKYKSKLDYEGKVSGSCIHCHQIRDAERRVLRDGGGVLPHDLLTPYPMPSVLGIEMDRKTAAHVRQVREDSVAAAAGVQAGDVILGMGDQAVVSLADMQWVLHHVEAPDTLTVRVRRGNSERDLVLKLEPGWDRHSDISWRVSSWDLRRMAFGGMYLTSLSDAERTENGLAPGQLGLLAKHVGQYGDHAIAKRAGVKKGDVIVKFDGIERDLDESALLREVLGKRRRGEQVSFTYLRNGEKKETTIRLQ